MTEKQLLIDCKVVRGWRMFIAGYPHSKQRSDALAEIDATLAQPAAQGGAVAWQYRHRGGEWTPCTKEQYEHVLRTGNFGLVGDECESRALCVRQPQQSSSPASDCYDLRPDDSIKKIAEEMVSAWSAARQGDAEITLGVVDEWMYRIMCFADYVRPGTNAPQQQARATDVEMLTREFEKAYVGWFNKDYADKASLNPYALKKAIRAVADQLAGATK